VEPGGGLNDCNCRLVVVVNVSVVVVDIGGSQVGLNERTQKIRQRSCSTEIDLI
jgi:hypothetical protein